MKTSTKKDIEKWIQKHWPVTVKQIKDTFDIFSTMIHRHLISLVEERSIVKMGKAPKVFYMSAITKSSTNNDLDYKDISYLDRYYYNYDSDGTILQWYAGFISRCQDRHLDIQKQFTMYKNIISAIEKSKDKNGLLDWNENISEKLGKIYIDDLRFIDAYQIGHFGRSKLGSTTFYAKQSQNKQLVKQVIESIRTPIQKYIMTHKIDAICYIPPSITRGIQLMHELRKQLKIELPEIKLIKVFPTNIVIPQKSLKSMEQRIKNATNTIFVSPWQKAYKSVLLIDDFMWSWATINFSAKKILDAKLAKRVVAISLLGNIDTKYDVINEV